MSRRALESLKQYSEVNLFQRGIIPLLGYRSTIVYYKRGNVSPGRPRPNMRFVPIKNVVQQGVLALHRVRQGFVKARTAQASQIRGLLAEFGVVIPQRITQLFAKMPEVLEDATNELPGSVRALMRRRAEIRHDRLEGSRPIRAGFSGRKLGTHRRGRWRLPRAGIAC